MAHAQQPPTSLNDLPPSAKFVHFVLKQESHLTQGELTDRTQLSTRTVRDALRKLEAAGIVHEDVCLRDARKRVYSLEKDN
ncbi:winged helix-turn-helix domain-containing protein [Halogeometricum borinquense]|uniref:Winged helix-turn-helix domain-containing protein n=1 Tax=Halogeometricum borinquense TaxID=60847 RepID=A0A6C0UIE7_9EURY|nr:winged helix-turn-helix domain-containing protein [Halogeometricum borinquense]QIB74373.1 winged helix-turn-helix domain-containing protein [Halogeometricum borinquense]